MSHQFVWIPSTNYSKASKPRTRITKFGGGYSQRVPDSYNNIDHSWSLTFQNRPFTEANAIIAFLEDKEASEAFDFAPPDEEVTIHKVICQEWSAVTTSHFSKTISCVFVKVYE